MKTIYNHIKTELEKNENFRERKYRDVYIRDLVLEKENKMGVMFLDINSLIDFAKDFESYLRIWRKVLQDNEHLQGSDYSPDKDILEQKVQIDLDYQPGYKQMVK